MRRIFITGGTGFFGKSMLDLRLRSPDVEWAKAEWVILSRDPDAFRAANPQFADVDGVKWIAGDVRDFTFPEGRFDAIIHAATSAVTTISDEEQTSVILDGTRHVAEFAERCGCRKVLFTSSGAVYGPEEAPVDETAPCRPVTAYGRGKLAAERILLESGLDVKIARCFAFTGPHLNRNIHFAIGNFMRDCLVVSDDGYITGKDAFEAYRNWCKDSGYEAGGKQSFFHDLRERSMMVDSCTVKGKTLRNVIPGFKLADGISF